MAITVGNTTASRGMSSEATSWTYSHNHDAGTNDCLFAMAQWFRPRTVSSVTYNGVSLTHVVTSDSGYDAAIYRLLAPSSGANNLVWTFSGTTGATFGSVSLHGVHQTTPTGATNGGTGTSNSPSNSLTTTAANSYLVDSIYRNNANTMTAGAGQTEFQDNVTQVFGSEGGGASYKAATTVGSYSMAWSWSSSTAWSQALAEVLEAVSATIITPAAQVVTASLPTRTIKTGNTRSATAQVATFSIPTYTVKLPKLVAVAAQVATFSIPTYVIDAGGNITVATNTQTLTASLPTRSVLLDTVIGANAQVATFSTPASSVLLGDSVTITPAAQVATLSIPNYSITTQFGAIVSVVAQALTFTLPTLEKVGGVWTKRARQTTADWSRRSFNDD